MDDFYQTLKFRIKHHALRIEIKGSFEELADYKKQQKT